MLNWLSAKLMTTSVGDFLLAKSFEGAHSGADATTVQKHEYPCNNTNWFWWYLGSSLRCICSY